MMYTFENGGPLVAKRVEATPIGSLLNEGVDWRSQLDPTTRFFLEHLDRLGSRDIDFLLDTLRQTEDGSVPDQNVAERFQGVRLGITLGELYGVVRDAVTNATDPLLKDLRWKARGMELATDQLAKFYDHAPFVTLLKLRLIHVCRWRVKPGDLYKLTEPEKERGRRYLRRILGNNIQASNLIKEVFRRPKKTGRKDLEPFRW
jgi:hypothetical protein